MPGSPHNDVNGGTLVSSDTIHPVVARVQVGIDAAVVADHHVTIRETTIDAVSYTHLDVYKRQLPGGADHPQRGYR